jgi:DNA-binding NarL/FixJ family response regulator
VNIEAISLIQDLDVDIMIIDGNVSGSKVNDIITRVKQLLPFAKILVFSTFTDNSTIISALKSGACGYILKNETPE